MTTRTVITGEWLVVRAKFLVICSVLLACCTMTLRAQTDTATVSGLITDSQGAIVPNAEVQLQSVARGTSQTLTTNDAGIYVFAAVQPGSYQITVRKQGFKQVDLLGMIVNVQDHVEQNFKLELGSVSESITVEGNGLNINTTDGTVSTVVDRQFVENLPLNGRTFQQLITLTPGVNLIGSAGSTGTSSTGEFTVNGQRATANYFTVDGVSANIGMTTGSAGTGVSINGVGNAAGGTNAMVSVDDLQEFRILTSSFAPEYGRTPGGQVILLTRSGTNQLHGTLYEYFRNTVLDANDWFANQAGQPRPPLRFNDFGGTLGGPIVKNKTFFFFSYEGQRLDQPEFSITSVPDAASRSAAPPQTQFILNAFPLPNGPELGGGLAQFSAGYSNPIKTNAASLRLDHTFNDKVSAFARYSYAPSSSEVRQPTDDLALNYGRSLIAQTITGGATFVITPRVVNELRLNFSESSVTQTHTQDGFGGATPPSGTALFVSPNSVSDASASVYTNWGALAQGSFGGLKQRQINLIDGISWAVGSHQFKFGFDYLRQLPINTGEQSDYYGFTDVASVVSNFLEYAGSQSDAPIHADVTEFSLYLQDTWHASSRLTLTYGLRWDFNPPPRSRYPNNQDYIPIYLDTAGNVTVGKAGSSYWNTQYKNFAPRLGVAYTLRQRPGWETVARGGIGLFYDIGTEEATLAGWNDYPTFLYSSVSNVPFPLTPEQVALPPIDLTSPPPGSNFTVFPRDFSSPRTWEWNVSVQQALGTAQTLTVSYVAALGRELVYGQNYEGGVGPQGYELVYYSNAGNSDYESLQVQFQRRLSRGLAATAAYTFGHSIDTNSDDVEFNQLPTTIVNANSSRGPSDFDIRHSFNAALSYSLPGYGGEKWLAALSKGWGLDAIITAHSALPVDIVSNELAPNGGYYYLRPDVVTGVPLYLSDASVPGGKVINSAAFVINPNGEGDLGRNAFRGFDLVETDISARRSFHLSERFNLLFRADIFNLFNHANFANPIGDLTNAFFGQSIATADTSEGGSGSSANSALNSAFQTGGPRTAQLSLKLQF